MTLRNDAGQVLIAGLSGPDLTALERATLRLLAPGGIILFRRNIHSAAQTHALLSDLRTLADEPLLRAVDLEGGLVDRLRETIAPMPAPALVGEAVARSGKPRLAFDHGRLIAREVRALGFNTIFAPVLDLRTERSAEVLRTRTASDDPEHVARYAAQFLKGLRREHILGCGKHFPGLGHGAVDSHASTPTIDRTWQEMWTADLVPFRKLRGQLPIIMVAHARYPQATPAKEANQPASISPFWIRRVLQCRIGFDGLIVSDDMEMGGILHHASIEEATVTAVAAGTHLIEICKDPALLLRAYEAILREAERSRAFRHTLQSAARTVRLGKRRLLGRDRLTPAPTPEQVHALRETVQAYSAEVHRLAVA